MENNLYHFSLQSLLPLYFLSVSLAMITTNMTTDQSALLSFRAQIITTDPQHILAKNWSIGSSTCEWIGVTCGSLHRRVTALNISNMGLTGIIPPQLGNLSFLASLDMSINNFQGELPHELAQFRRLRVLNLGVNNINGEFPPWIGSLQKLQFLSLRNNTFTGVIPHSISNMSKLGILLLSFNSLQGNIPNVLFNISTLEVISLNANNLSGSVPEYMCQHLRKLTRLNLSQNKLNGHIPSSIAQCSQLQVLSLANNNFTGCIPKEIGNLKMLEILFFRKNNLMGVIPKEIGNATMLNSLDFEDNNIAGFIPREIGSLYNLEKLRLGANNLTGSVPIEIFNLSMMEILSLTINQLSGNLPSTIGYGLPNLQKLYLNLNNFSGVIPDSISNASKLNITELSFNKFSSSIPHSFGDLRFLTSLNLRDNNLMGDSSYPELGFITSLTKCKYLRILSVSNNQMNGILPNSVGNLSTSLEGFYAHNCKIKGNIPDGIGNLSNLISLSLYGNQLTGSLPTSVKDMQKIQGIDLHENKLSKVPLDYFCVFKNLIGLALQGNLISGLIPECLGNVTSLRYLYLDSNKFFSTLPTSIGNLKDLLDLRLSSNSLSGSLPPEIKNLKKAINIDLSMNQFSSGIPKRIGDLESLNYLSLAQNRLQGSIPESIGDIFSLEALDISHNFLSGSIPMSMENLRYLTYFNISFNNLKGKIPSNGPFTNFSSESFISNEALCGNPRFRVPPCPSTSVHKSRTKKMHRTIFIVLGVIIVGSAISFGFVYLRYRRKNKAPSDADMIITQERISYYKLLQATNGYHESNLLGTGSFGSVYRGTLDDGRVVAVKVFNLQVEGAYKSFDVECEVLRNIRHRNLTKVISSCSNLDFKALVLEFMPKGSLEKWLYSHNNFLNIIQRLDILIDVAFALHYLHYDYSTPVVHCDLKPSNVLLDQDMVAHVSDFGIAKLLSQENSITYTRTLASLCYLAPEYGMEGIVSTKCDIYSFGIMMMEVFTRTNPSSEMFGENLSMKSWVINFMPDALAHIIDFNLLRENDEHFLEKLDCISSIMKVALSCTRESPGQRSNMRDVLVALKKIKLQLIPYC